MWLYNAQKLKKTYNFTVFSTFWWLFKDGATKQRTGLTDRTGRKLPHPNPNPNPSAAAAMLA